MEEHAQKLEGPSMDALQMADAIKRIMMVDEGEMAERLDGIIEFPVMTGHGAIFYAITGKEPFEMMGQIEIDPEKIRKPTCSACHYANGLHEPDCPKNPSPQVA